MRKISVIIPCFNEEVTLADCLRKVLDTQVEGWHKEVILIDDGSTDRSYEIAQSFLPELVVMKNEKNLGKGAAVKKGLENCQGEVVLIQDADLEYDPADYQVLLAPFEKGASAVFGVRRRPYLHPLLWLNPYFWGGSFINLMANMLYLTWIKDIHSGYKLFQKELIAPEELTQKGFSFCHELAAHLLENKVEIVQIPIAYHPRSLGEGKKIRGRDGVQALVYLLKRRLKSML